MTQKRKSQTTSTKCQYQAPASNPKWCSWVKWWLINLIKQTAKKQVPIKTWNPWNPVARKKHEPYKLSEIVKPASAYSKPWNPVKRIAKRIPQGRMANKNEYNGALKFLLSDDSNYMNGSHLIIDGGRTIW